MARKTLRSENEALKEEIKQLKRRIQYLESNMDRLEIYRKMLIAQRVERRLQETPLQLVYEDEEMVIIDVPDNIHRDDKSETDDISLIGTIELYDDAYIVAIFTFNLDGDEQ